MNDTQKTQASNYALLVDPHTGHEFNLCRFATSIGRSIASDIVLLDRSVSRQHSVVYCIRGKFYVEDIGSTNGTMVNGAVIEGRVELQPGDEIRLGITRLVFLLIPDRSANGGVIISQDPTVPVEHALPVVQQSSMESKA